MFFLAGWLLLHLLQAAFTGILHDEAYYWMYSRRLAWGYFDHPPGIAVLVKAGYYLIPHTLGVRLFTCLLAPVGFWMIWRIAASYGARATDLLYLIAGTLLCHMFSFVSTPDAPLLVLTCLYLYLYRRYLQQDDWRNALLLGICIALMFYTKYHTALILLLTIAAYPRLLLRRTFYLVAGVALLCFLPHILWQQAHDWPSIRFHLAGRSREAYAPFITYSYILNEILVFGPLISLPMFWILRRRPSGDIFLRTLYVLFWGFLGFFMLSSFRGWVEPHWTSPVVPAFLVLGAIGLRTQSKGMQQFIRQAGLLTFLLLLPLRYILTDGDLAARWGMHTEIHNWDKWAEAIQRKTGDLPVIFLGSFQRPAKYTYFTGKFATSLNPNTYRLNQYDLWRFEDTLQGRRVALLTRNPSEFTSDSVRTPTGDKLYIGIIPALRSYYDLPIDLELPGPESSYPAGGRIEARITLHNTRSEPIILPGEGDSAIVLKCTYFLYKGIVLQEPVEVLWPDSVLQPGKSVSVAVQIPVPDKKGVYQMTLSLDTYPLPSAMNSGYHRIEAE